MKDKVLIIRSEGVGKTSLAMELASKLGYVLVDNVANIEEVKKKASPNTIYVSGGVDEHTALWHLDDFTIIKLVTI